MILEFGDGLLVVVVLLILFVDVVYCDADDVDHVPEEGSPNYLEDHDDHDLSLVLGREVPVAHSHNGGNGKVH